MIRSMTDESPMLSLDDLQLSDTAMIVDPEDLATLSEKQEVAILSPDGLDMDDSEADAEGEGEYVLMADDRRSTARRCRLPQNQR